MGIKSWFILYLLLIIHSLYPDTALGSGTKLLLATTTSVDNSGLLAHILPQFTNKTSIGVKVIPRGTGAALEMGKRGDVDLVLVHAKELELKLLEQGYFTNRQVLCFNDYVLLGPKTDKAGVRGSGSIYEAFFRIQLNSGLFVSRGDGSGTHMKELEIWNKITKSMEPIKSSQWYLEVGQGMAKTLMISSEKMAYTLSDRATWLTMKDRLELVVLFEGDPVLLNEYSIMAVNPLRHRHVKYKEAMELINWMTSQEGQGAIGSFKDINGNPLFRPVLEGGR